MAWKRGVFRLWIYLSTIWTVIVIIVGITTAIQQPHLITADELFGCNVVPRPADCGPQPHNTYAEYYGWWAGYWAAFSLKYILIAGIPIITMLAIGWGGFWVVEGFEKPSNAKTNP